jgi:pimeloyl-ACP methyl ester carboxylesterase
MNAAAWVGRLLVGLAETVLLAGCSTGSGPSAPPTRNVAYESANPVLVPGVLDIYAPTKAGPWPVVVMLHGGDGDKADQREYARRVADLGFVVFAPTWGRAGASAADLSWYDSFLATESQVACAVEFARAHAAEYGGDPATMILFGHSGGASIGAQVAFARPEPSAGCLGGTTLGPIDALVTWEGNFILSVNVPDLDGILAAEPRVLDVITPWRYLAEHKDQKVVMLVSENPGAQFERKVGDPWAADSWLAVRDPSGDLRRQLEANGAFADGTIGFADEQQLLYSVLRAQGSPVSLDVLPDSVHDRLSDAGWKVFLAAFPKAAAKD